MHILIVEDEPLTALMISDMLANLGGTSFDYASTEAEAIAKARHRLPDLITADVRLAEGNGIAAVAAIIRFGPVPFVYVTGTPEALSADLKPVTVTKPINETELRRIVERVLATH